MRLGVTLSTQCYAIAWIISGNGEEAFSSNVVCSQSVGVAA
jgi:hypothetical protein